MSNKHWRLLFLVVLFLDGALTHFFVSNWDIGKELIPIPGFILRYLGLTGFWAIRIVLGACLILAFIRGRISSVFKIVTVAEFLAVLWNFGWLVSYLMERPL
ncbi:MAG: hypothetical protein FJ044_05700 [Candidatus Cloacimonetes bacterium]|nr:hypothetical protein [Candidatus Cloacimonadota bacterium]